VGYHAATSPSMKCLIPRAVRHPAYRHHESTLVGWRQLREAQGAAMNEPVRVVALVALVAIPVWLTYQTFLVYKNKLALIRDLDVARIQGRQWRDETRALLKGAVSAIPCEIARKAREQRDKTRSTPTEDLHQRVADDIGTFDDEVFRVLSEMAASPAYWQLICEYRKMPAGAQP
jgi:hypothetical protein